MRIVFQPTLIWVNGDTKCGIRLEQISLLNVSSVAWYVQKNEAVFLELMENVNMEVCDMNDVIISDGVKDEEHIADWEHESAHDVRTGYEELILSDNKRQIRRKVCLINV